jgi:hypothetical protein
MSYHRLKLGTDNMKDSCPWCTFCVLGAPKTRKSLIFQVIISHNFTKICHLNLPSMGYHRLKLGTDKMKDSCPWCIFCVLGAPRTRK